MLCQIDQIWFPLHYLGYDFTKFTLRFSYVKATTFGRFDITFFTVSVSAAAKDVATHADTI